MSGPVTWRRLPIPLALLVVAFGPVGCGGASVSAPPRPVPAPTPASTPASTTTTVPTPARVEREIRRAYLASWDAYAHAVWSLDPSDLDRWYAGPEVATILREVEWRVRERRRSRVRVTHDVTVTILGPDRAVIVDRLLNESVGVHADTGEDLELAPYDHQYWQFTLERKADTWASPEWKVVYSARS